MFILPNSPIIVIACAWAAAVAAVATCSTPAQPITAADFVHNIHPGWNPGNTMDAMPTETSWGQPLLVNSTFTNVKMSGFRGVRLPVTYADHFVSDAPDYIIDPVWLQRVSDVVDMITSNGMYAMVNSHHDSWSWLDPTAPGANQTKMESKFYAMWYQIGTKLACKPLSVGFEALNEPSGSSASDAAFLNTLQAIFVKAINDAGGWNPQRVVILGGMGDAYTNMVAYWKPPPNITNPVVLTYHYYGPWDWTATAWGRTIWGSDSDKQAIANDMRWAHDNFTDYPMIIGEYATSPATTEAAARWKWYDFVVRTANIYGAACMLWDAGGSFQVNSSSPWPDQTTLNIIATASDGTPNALADSTEDSGATSQWSSAYVWHKHGEPVVDDSLPMLWNGNTLEKIWSSPGVTGVESSALTAGIDYFVVGSNLTFTASFLRTLFPDGSEPGFKANLTLHFNRGADLELMAYQYSAPTLAFNTFKVTAANQHSDLVIPIIWKGRVQVAAARHIFTNGTYMADSWTTYLGPLQQARMTGGYTWNNSHIILQAAELQLAYAGQTSALYTFEFFPREAGNTANLTITV